MCKKFSFFPHSVAIDSDVQTATPIPLDIALIVVAAIVSLGLTSVAVVMVLHMRSKLFEAVRLAVYDDEKTKTKGPERESANSDRMSTLINSSLPPRECSHSPGVTPPHLILDCGVKSARP